MGARKTSSTKRDGGGRGPERPASAVIEDASLADEAQKRYLSYALSVITSRALPDVRDGLKPVHRRILYAMHHELGLRHDGRHVKSARVVGEVMGKYHPHGDQAIYDSLARMAQDFSMRAPLVDGHGNFGSVDGDAPAAMRYTECKLARLSSELLSELGQKTVEFRPNYDGQNDEPTVLPARFPNLLVNGSQGIAVGMATSIPPHNLGEIINASLAMIEEPEVPLARLLKHVRGPDFPTGGLLVTTKRELSDVYETGQGLLKLRGEWKEEPASARENPRLVITSIPYAVERKTVVERIADVIIEKKLPHLVDVRDESTEECRIVLELRKDADAQLVMAYLYKHTPLQSNVQVNLTCLVPTAREGVLTPSRLSLVEILRHFLDFRMEVVTRRLRFDLDELTRRIHVLEGFVTIFDALDETIRIIRASDGKADAAAKLMKRFGLTEAQVDAILELRLYRLAKLEINIIRTELAAKQKEAARLERLLASPAARWKLIRTELEEVRGEYATARLTKVTSTVAEPEFASEDFIVSEDQVVLLTQRGWVKRQGRVADLAATRVREGDLVLDVTAGSTRECVAFFSSLGSCYVCRIVDVPATSGYGSPIQTLFKLDDGERIVRMLGFDPRVLEVPPSSEGDAEPGPPHALGVSKGGMATRFSLRQHRDVSTKAGRRFMRLREGDEVLAVELVAGTEKVACASKKAHALVTTSDEIPLLAGPGRGVTLIKLDGDDELIGARVLVETSERLLVENEAGKQFEVGTTRALSTRGGKGQPLFKRGELVREVPREPTVPALDGGSE